MEPYRTSYPESSTTINPNRNTVAVNREQATYE